MSEETISPVEEQQSGPSPEEIAAEVVKQMPEKAPEEPTMTEQELAAHLQVWEPNEQFADAFRTAITDENATSDDRMRAFEMMRDGVVNQATRGAELMIEDKFNELRNQVSPATEYAYKAQAEAMWTEFTGKHPELSDHKDLVDMVSSNLASSGYKPTSKDELYGKVAEAAEGMIKRFDHSFSLNKDSQPKQSQGNMPEMSGSGGVSQGGPGTPTSRGDGANVESLWG
tara:strand:- start:1691 stop:2374 length:684 start_codon:yes stop_codon:yes gene_type:complete